MPSERAEQDRDLALVAGLAGGDVDALARLYDLYGALAYSVALRVLGDPGRAEDVVQECFLKIWDAAGTFDQDRGSLRAWLITLVRNRSVDHLRGRGAHERQERAIPLTVEATGRGADPWHEVSLSIERDIIREALDDLPKEQRQAIELAYFGGYTYPEIAEMVRVPLSTVKGRMRLALEKLHSYLQGRGLAYDS